MRGWKKVLMILLIVLLFSAVGTGLAWHFEHYIMVDLHFYPRNARTLDLRGEKITISHYEKLRRSLPGCEIAWDVPFQQGTYPHDAKKVTLSALTEADISVLDYLTELETVEAEGCTDYGALLSLEERRPGLTLNYTVQLGQETYSRQAKRIDVKHVQPHETERLACFPQLHTVVCSGGQTEQIAGLQQWCRDHGLTFRIGIGGKAVSETVEELTLKKIRDEEAALLQFLPNLKQVHLVEPEAAPETLIALRNGAAGLKVTWEAEICGVLSSSEDAEIDLSKAEIESLRDVEAGMAWFPDAETVFLGKCDISNESLADFRERMREHYKVVWTVELGEKLTARTDDTTFMPVRTYVYYFNDKEAENLRYCEDMVCIDIGHMSIHHIDFVEFMPDLEYLVLAHTQVNDISAIVHCRKLKFLELDWTPLKDYTPLLELENLEDLNLGNTFGDFTPIGKMTWLKNLWMIGCSRGPAYKMTEALPDTTVMITGAATVANGWRKLDNYYEMRDLLGMEYMGW